MSGHYWNDSEIKQESIGSNLEKFHKGVKLRSCLQYAEIYAKLWR